MTERITNDALQRCCKHCFVTHTPKWWTMDGNLSFACDKCKQEHVASLKRDLGGTDVPIIRGRKGS